MSADICRASGPSSRRADRRTDEHRIVRAHLARYLARDGPVCRHPNTMRHGERLYITFRCVRTSMVRGRVERQFARSRRRQTVTLPSRPAPPTCGTVGSSRLPVLRPLSASTTTSSPSRAWPGARPSSAHPPDSGCLGRPSLIRMKATSEDWRRERYPLRSSGRVRRRGRGLRNRSSASSGTREQELDDSCCVCSRSETLRAWRPMMASFQPGSPAERLQSAKLCSPTAPWSTGVPFRRRSDQIAGLTPP